MTGNLKFRPAPGGVEFTVFAAPRSRNPGVTGIHADAIRVAVRSAPERGRANEELAEVLAAFLGVRKGAVEIVAGGGMRRKRVRVDGVSPAMLLQAVERL